MKSTDVKKRSLIKRVTLSYIFIICIMIIPTLYSVIVGTIHSNRYDDIISNTGLANSISLISKNEIPNELWDIVSGRKTFNDGNQYKQLMQIEKGLEQMKATTKDREGRQRLEVASRTLETLSRNVSRLGIQIAEGNKVAENEVLLDEIRSITVLFSDVLQNFIVYEIQNAYETNNSIRKSSIVLTVIQIFICLAATAISFQTFISLSKHIRKPIHDMKILSEKIAKGDLEARVKKPNVEELDDLSENLNIMAERISVLIDQHIKEQKQLQMAEMKTLQAQITPHFLYNTFDTIIWLAEENRIEEAVRITRAFSDFLRISLSRGHEWITLAQEIDHVKSYLTIQKVRYAEILDYEINYDEDLSDFKMLKFTLQPLVENAIYHGIKNKRGRGHLKLNITAEDKDRKFMRIDVEDDGAGFTEERLSEVQREISLAKESCENLTSVYGLYNVNKRLVLYYNGRTEGIQIESRHRKGTKISFTLPCIPFSENKKKE